MSVPVTNGTGSSSVAAEVIATQQYQQIKLVGGETGSTSVMGVNPDRSINVSVIGAVQITGSVQGAGSVAAFQAGTWATSIISGNASVITVWQNSSVIAVVTGSVATIPSGNQSVSGTVGSSVIGWVPIQPSNTSTIGILQNSSFIAINAGSVIAVPSGSVITVLQAPSIVGTYAEDAAAASGDKGFFVLGVRNDTLSSVTSADGDYSPMAQGPAGETVVANAPLTKWVQGTADLRGNAGGSVTVIAAQGSSVFTYITGVQVANMGTASVLVTLSGATSSIIAYTIAPGGGGSNIVYQNAIKTNANAAFAASISGQASVLVSAQGFISKT